MYNDSMKDFVVKVFDKRCGRRLQAGMHACMQASNLQPRAAPSRSPAQHTASHAAQAPAGGSNHRLTDVHRVNTNTHPAASHRRAPTCQRPSTPASQRCGSACTMNSGYLPAVAHVQLPAVDSCLRPTAACCQQLLMELPLKGAAPLRARWQLHTASALNCPCTACGSKHRQGVPRPA